MSKIQYTEGQLNKKHVVMFYLAGDTKLLVEHLVLLSNTRENTKGFIAGKLPQKLIKNLESIEPNFTHNLPVGSVRTLNLKPKTKIDDFYEFCRLAKHSIILVTEKFNDYAEIMPVFDTGMKGLDFIFEIESLDKLAEFVSIFENENIICCLPITQRVNNYFMNETGFLFENIERLQGVFTNVIISKIMFACTEFASQANLMFNISAGVLQGVFSEQYTVDNEANMLKAFADILTVPAEARAFINDQIAKQFQELKGEHKNILDLPPTNN